MHNGHWNLHCGIWATRSLVTVLYPHFAGVGVGEEEFTREFTGGSLLAPPAPHPILTRNSLAQLLASAPREHLP